MSAKQILEKQNKDLKIRLENMAPKFEMRQKDETIKMLQKNICELEKGMEEQIKAALAKAVAEAVAPLIEELSKAHTEIARLKAIINKDSSNSSKPSSTNGFKEIPNSREMSTKKQGGQKGHHGSRLKLPENMAKLEAEGIIERRIVDNTNGKSEYVSKYTIDIETKVIITEHRFSKGKIPEAFYNEVSYGENIKAHTILLMNEGIVAHKRLSGIISGVTHGTVNLSTGTMNRFQADFAGALEESKELDAVKQDLLNGEVMNVDDTSMRVQERIVYPDEKNPVEPKKYERAEKKSFKATIRTYSNEQSTLYTVNPKKDKEGVERDGILPAYMGDLCHDHESKFRNYGKRNGDCGVHLSRDLKGLSDSYNCPWAEKMRGFVLGMNEHKNNDLLQGITACNPGKLKEYEAEYDRLLEEGRNACSQMNEKEWGQREFNAMLNRLENYKDNYMLFLRDYKVPFSNNLAERDLRGVKIKEKVSGLFRSWEGIEDHSTVRSFISTIKKRGKDLFCSIKKVMRSEPVLST